MILSGDMDSLSRLLGGWIAGDPEAQTLEVSLEWDPVWSAGVLLAFLAAAWILPALLYRSRRIEIGPGWRLALGALRGAALTAALAALFGPRISAVLEKMEPRTIAVLLDSSASMAMAGDSEARPSSRWELAVSGLRSAFEKEGQRLEKDKVRLEIYLFDEYSRRSELDALSGGGPRPSGPRTDIGGALAEAGRALACDPRSMVLLISDGAENFSSEGSGPLRAATELSRAGIPVHTCLAGRKEERRISLSAFTDAPYAYAGDPIPIHVRVDGKGIEGAQFQVTVSEGGRTIDSREVKVGPEGSSATAEFEVRFDGPGLKTCRVEPSGMPGELAAASGSALVEILVVDQPLRVLYIERWPRWQYRFLTNTLRRDRRMEPTFVLLSEDPRTPADERETALFPSSAEDLSRFDALVIGDVAPQDLTGDQWRWIETHVRDGGAGCVFIAGPAHDPKDLRDLPIGPLLPFEGFSPVAEEGLAPYRPSPTPLGLHHPILRLGLGEDSGKVWKDLPALLWYAPVRDLKPAAAVLLERPADPGGEPVPLVIFQRVGKGSVLFVGTDETWKWRYQVGNRYFYGFWAQAIRHVGMPHRTGEFQTVRWTVPRRAVSAGTPVSLSLALDPASAGAGLMGAESIAVQGRPVEGGRQPLRFQVTRSLEAPSVYRGSVRFPEAGVYKLSAEGLEGRGEAAVEVSPPDPLALELSDPRTDPTLLRGIAGLTGGESVELEGLEALIHRLDLAPVPERFARKVDLARGWALVLILAALLAAEWALRKWRYLP